MFQGIVIHGDGLGKGLGYPTANLDISAEKTRCKDGVYAAKAYFRKKEYKAALIIQSARKKVEVYLFDYKDEDFYGLELEVDPVQKVSEIETYENDQKLKEKIAKDIELIEQVF